MRNTPQKAAGLAIGLLALAVPMPVHAQLANGSFEAGTFTNTGPFDAHIQQLLVGSTAMTGWTVVSDEIGWARNDNPFVPNGATDGQFFLDLTGFSDSPPHGGVRQTVATVPGQAYVLQF